MSQVIKSIKSNYIYNCIFVLLNEKIKLKLIKYNKYSQNYLKIGIINYQRFSGKYIIYETDTTGKTIGKEFNWENIMLFEGAYYKGEKNGEGKEYVEYTIKFEGTYLNGKKMDKEKNMIKMVI